jgi:TetR/AcrR family transcriptional regulator, regulator of autoinduction and epiphytic fitness
VQEPSVAPRSVPTDGRAARALRTREAIVDACIAMVEEGDLRPTAPRLAERAGVSVRSVFQHFDDLPSLHIAVTQRIAERMSALLVPPDTTVPLDRRIERFVEHRASLLEAATPFRRAAQVHGPFSPEIRAAITQAAAYLHHEVEATFAPELGAGGPGAGGPGAGGPADRDRSDLLEALAAAASWPCWDVLRTEHEVPSDQARAVMVRTLRALLAPSR